MPALKRTGSAVSKSGLPPPSKVGRSHGPLEEEDDDVFFEGQPIFPLTSAVPASDANGKSDDKMDVDLAPPQKATNKKTKPTTGHRPINSYFNEPIKVPSTPPVSRKEGRRLKVQDVSPEASSSEITTSGAAPKTRAEKRSAKRQGKPAKDAREKRKLSAATAQDDILAVDWFSQTPELLSRSRTIDNIINAYDPDASIAEQKSMLRTLFNTTSDLDSVERVPDDSPFWTIFANMDVATTRFFFSLARGLQLADIQQAVDAGVLRLSPPNDPKPVVGNLAYIRVGDCQSPLDAGRACLVAGPSDTPWTLVRLIDLGMPLDDVEVCVGEVLEPFGHRGAVQPLFSRLKDETTVHSPRASVGSQSWLYSGTSEEKQPGDRHADDEAKALKNDLQSRFGRFLQQTAGRCSWRCYEILPFHLPNSSGIRVDPTPSAVERFVIAMQAGRGLNSAVGGFSRPYIPPPALRDLISSLPPPMYGQHATPISARVNRLYDDERSSVVHHGHPEMPDASFRSAIKNASSVLRSNGHSIPYFRTLKDISFEDFVGEDKAPWQANTGKALQLFRHNLCLLDPELSRDGDLSEEEIALRVGPSADCWRVVTGQPDYWLHALWMTRLWIVIEPVVLSIWSHPILSSFISGSFHIVWQGLPDSIRDAVLSGNTPLDIHEYLPPSHGNSNWCPQCAHDKYLESVGTLFIARYGPRPTHILLLIPNLDCGVSKYRPGESFFVETIILIVSAIERIALDHVQRLHDQGINPDRTDKERAWEYFRLIKAEVESDVTYVALKLELEIVKGKYAQRTTVRAHLDSLAHPNPSHSSRASPASPAAAPYEIPGITRTSELGPARLAQLDTILAHISSLTDGGFPVDAFGLVPFHLRNRIHSPEFRAWFLSLPAGIRISASARIWGNSPEAYANTIANHAKFAGNKAAHSAGGKATAIKFLDRKSTSKMLLRFLEEAGDLIRRPPPRRKGPLGSVATRDTWRAVLCETCWCLIVADDANVKHACAGESFPVNDGNIPNIQRLLYPHDLLSRPDLAVFAPEYTEIVAPINIADVIKRRGNAAKARKLFPDTDFSTLTGVIHVGVDCTDAISHNDLHLGMALDIAVSQLSLSRCPEDMLPVTGEDRSKAWSGDATNWLDDRYSVVKCAWGHFEIMVLRTANGESWFDHHCKGTDIRRPLDPSTNRRIVGSRRKGGDSDCGSQRSHDISTIYDLPPDHIRRLVYNHFIARHQPPLAPKKNKAAKS